MCPHTTICVLIPLYMCPGVGAAGAALVRGPCAIWADRREELVDHQARHCAIYVSAYYYIASYCVLSGMRA